MMERQPSQPLVSVVLPTYKRAHLLRYAVDSVLAQTYPNIELIIVDDCSPDDTPAVAQQIVDPRVRYNRNKTNLKLPATLNRGVSLSQGDYLTWTSDDNLFTPRAIEKMVERLRAGDCEFVFADYFDYADLDADTGRPVDAIHEKLPFPPVLEKVNRIGACFLYTRNVYETIGDYDTELFLVEDYDYFIRISKRFAICHIPEPLYYFRRFDESLFCSRFHEIKAADMLVRYRNGLLSKEQAVDTLVTTILSSRAQLTNRPLRIAKRVADMGYWRFQKLYQSMAKRHLSRSLGVEIPQILSDLDAGALSFADAKDRTSNSIRGVASLAYSR